MHPEDPVQFVRNHCVYRNFFREIPRASQILPESFLVAVAARGGFVYPGFSTDPVENFSRTTTTQAWTVRAALLPRRGGATR